VDTAHFEEARKLEMSADLGARGRFRGARGEGDVNVAGEGEPA
jgi:hypothetical protein